MPGTAIQITGLTDLQNHLDTQQTHLQTHLQKALLLGGLAIEGEAKRLCPVDTGRLRASIQTTIQKQTDTQTLLTIGTAVDYAPYIEYGTGLHAENGQGRKTPWTWKGDGKKWPGWHKTTGQPPQPYLRPAFDTRKDETIQIIADTLKHGTTP